MTNPYSLETPERVAATLAERVKDLRLAKGWKQATLAQRSGVSLGSLRRFEESGQVSLENLLKLVFTLDRIDDFAGLLKTSAPATLAELESLYDRPVRKRGRV